MVRWSTSTRWRVLSAAALLLVGCVESFEPKVTASQTALLVVDGFINSKGVTTIKLSRTTDLATTDAPPAESKAILRIEDEAGSQMPLVETTAGTYVSQALTLNPAKKYRLHLFTAARQEYVSDYLPVIVTPAIDNVYWVPTNEGAGIYVDTHNAPDKSHYYQWEFAETWEFTSAFVSEYVYKDGKVVERTGENIYNCWGNYTSTRIDIAATTGLSENTIKRHPVTVVPSTSVKLRYRYSILVRQHAQSKEEYEYAGLLKKNTEDIGNIFGPLPVQLTGNVHSVTNAGENVIGFVGVTSLEEKRIFISRSEIPAEWRPSRGLEEICTRLDTVLTKDIPYVFPNPGVQPVSRVFSDKGSPIGYTSAPTECVDCRKTGTNVKPSFWP